ncbi:MAG TPA: alpha-L-fucosidase [Rhodothermales bacterium]|nr:alpha-L-fucosidase [Rhodothermales bacterium]
MKLAIPGCFLMCLLVGIALCGSGCTSENATSRNYLNESTAEIDERMAWWRDARFGMFIHWGPYAVPAGIYQGERVPGLGEWIMHDAAVSIPVYEEFARRFNPVQFDAEAWVRAAKDAGMKYIVITAKHHDGFSLWNSPTTTYDFADFTPFNRDALRELAEACQKHDMPLGFYYSILDWHHPDAQGDDFATYREDYVKPQLTELVEQYDPAILWFDGEWIDEWTEQQGRDLYNYLRNLKPDLLINNRIGKGRDGMQGMSKDGGNYVGDFGTPEQQILDTRSTFDWESCMTMNDTWGYKSYDDNWKSAETLLHNLIDIVAKGGNYLLNVGPTAEGNIPQPSLARLAEMGAWMRVHGEALYGSRSVAAYQEGENIRYTQSKDEEVIYAISLTWPGEHLLLHQVKPTPGKPIKLLGFDAPLDWQLNEQGDVLIDIPSLWQDPTRRPVKHAWVFRIEGESVPVASTPVIRTGEGAQGDRIVIEQKDRVYLEAGADEEVYYTLDGSLPDENAIRYEAPFQIQGDVILQARAFRSGAKPGKTAVATFVTVDARTNGLGYKYYEGDWWQLPDFERLTAEKEGAALRFDPDHLCEQKENCGLLFEGEIDVPQPGRYTFYLQSDDGSRLYIDDQEVIDNDGIHGLMEKQGRVTLEQGRHSITLQYFQRRADYDLTLFVEGPGLEKRELAADMLYQAP